MSRSTFDDPVNPYHYALHCIGGKWKMTILHEIHTFGSIRFNQTLRILPISEKVLSQQLKELIHDGLVQRLVYNNTYPPTTDYVLTNVGNQIMPALDLLFIWSVRQMAEQNIPIDEDAFSVHQSEQYINALQDLIEQNNTYTVKDPSSRNAKKQQP